MRWMSRNAEWVFCRVPHVRTAVSPVLAEYYASTSGREVACVQNGVAKRDPAEPTWVSDLGLDPGSYVLYVGRIEPAKGIHLLIDAFTGQFEGLKLAIVGDMPSQGGYRSVLEAKAGADVAFLGYRGGAELQALYDQCAVFVLPSLAEGQSMVLMEALASGCRTLYSDLPENRALMGAAGTVFRSGDASDLRVMLTEVLRTESRGPLESVAADEILAAHDWDRIVDAYLDCYGSAISLRTRRDR